MAALTKRDIEMIFRAETDAAQRPVNELSSDVKRLRQSLEELAKAGGKTDASLDALAATTRDLEKAQQELGTARTLLTQLNAQTAALQKAEAAVESSTQKFKMLQAQVEGAEKPTKRLTNSLAAAERGMTANNARLEEARKNYAEVKSSIEGIIGPVDNLQDAFRTVAVAQRDITQGLATAKNAVGQFKTEIAAANAEAEKLKGVEAFKTDARAAGLSEAQISAIAEETNRTQLLAQAKRDLAQQDAKYRAAAEAAAATSSLRLLEAIDRTRQATAETVAAEQRLSQVDAFRKIAADSLAASSAAERVKAGLDGGTTSAQHLANAIQNLVNPARAAAVTIEGIETRLDGVIKQMSGGKLSVSEWYVLNNELESIQANLIKASAEVDNFTRQQQRVDSASAAYDVQAAKVRELAQTQVQASTNVEELTADLNREEAALVGLGMALDRETAKLKEFGGALQRLGVDSDNLPQSIKRIESAATRAAPAIRKVSEAVSPNGRKGFLGLDPFQLQNLSYQVNDVFTGLASGQPVFQVFAQQAGQIVQIFPGIISGFAAWLPLILPVAAALAVLTGSISEANTQLETLRTANTVLASLGETNGYDAKKFQQIVKDFRDIGVSAEEATAAAKIFVTEGLNPAAVDDYIIAAKNLADVNNTDVKTATEELTKAFTAGADEVIKLDDKYHFLTETQRENLIASKDTKTEYEEVNKAFTALYKKMQDGANAARGPMTEATNTLRNAWRALTSAFADTGAIEAVKQYLADAVLGFTYLINVARRTAKVFSGVGSAFANGGPLGFLMAGAQLAKNLGEGKGTGVLDGARQDTFAQMAAARNQYTRPQGNWWGSADAGQGSRERQKNDEARTAKDKKQAERDAKKAAREAEADAKRRAREAEQLAKQYANEQDQLSSALSRFTVEALRGTQAPLEQQLEMARQAVDEQFKALEDRLSEFRAKFGADAKINGMSQEAYGAALNQQKQQIVLARQLGVFESNVNDILKSRSERLKAIREQQDAGLISAQEALDKTAEVTSTIGPKLDEAIGSARAFIAALTPSSETQALLDKFDRIQQQGSPDNKRTIDRKQAEYGASQQEKDLNDLFQRRAALIAAANNMYEIGALNYTQREEQIKLAYASTNAEISNGIKLAREFIEANMHLLPPDVASNALAQLNLYNSQLKYTSELQQQVKVTAEQAFAQGFMSMFDTLAQGIANVVTGAGSLKDLFSDLGRAALNFAATFAKAIADAIIQIYALRVAKSLIGGFHGGGTVGDYGAGQMKLSRSIGPSDLSSVPRYHNGTQGAGLKSNEMLAVLQKGEKVQTEEQQRLEANRLKAARGGSGPTSLRQVLAFGDDEIAAAMQGEAGARTTITHIRRNAPLIKQLLRD